MIAPCLRLTDTIIAELRCPEGKRDAMFFDNKLEGFGIRVGPDRPGRRSRKVFLIQYRARCLLRRETVGVWGTELTTTQARRRAEVLREQVRRRRDPVAEQQAAKVERRAAAAEAKRQAAADAFTFEKLIAAWESRSLVDQLSRYDQEAATQLRRSFPLWLSRPAAIMTRIEAGDLLQEMADERGTIAANRILAHARACYGWAIEKELLEANPFANLSSTGSTRLGAHSGDLMHAL